MLPAFYQPPLDELAGLSMALSAPCDTGEE